MKVLFLTNIPSPYRVEFFNGLCKKCDLTVLFERETATDRDSSWYGRQFDFKYKFLHSLKLKEESSLSLEVIKYLKKEFDLVIISGYSSLTTIIAILYLKIIRKKFVMVVDGSVENKNKGIKFILKKYLISAASAWLSTGECTTNYLIQHGAIKEKIYKYPLSSFNKTDFSSQITLDERKILKEELGIKEDKIIIYVGRLIPRKRVDLMLKSCSSIENTRIIIIGGEETDDLYKIRKENKMDNVTYISHSNKKTVKKYFLCADLFVFLAVNEMWGLVVAEAMSQGCPVLATDGCPAAKELIENEINGFIINKDIVDPKLINKKIVSILNLGSCKTDLRNEAYKAVKEYTIENMVSVNYDIFCEILDDKTR